MSTHIRNFFPWEKPRPFPAGSVVVITGAGSGIGRAVALLYARRKARLVLADVNTQGLEATNADCMARGALTCINVRTDVTVLSQCEELMRRTKTESGGNGSLHTLVLCAGIGGHHLFRETENVDQMFDKMMKVNFFGYMNCTKAAYGMLERSAGTLVAVTSFSGEVGLPYRTAYCASKFAVTGFLESLRSEMAVLKQQGKGEGFHITIVCPTTVDTPLRKNGLSDTAHRTEKGKVAMPVEECAAAIVDAADRRLRKAFFPWKSWIAAYVRPVFPDLLDGKIRKNAAL